MAAKTAAPDDVQENVSPYQTNIVRNIASMYFGVKCVRCASFFVF